MYKSIIYDKRTKKHRFLIDIDYANEIRKKQIEYNNMLYEVPNKIYKEAMIENKNKMKKVDYCERYYNKKSVITESEIFDISEEIKETKDENQLFQTLNKVIDKKLISTIHSIQDIREKFKKNGENELNVLIVGGGPNGLFLGNYINQLYNNSYSNIRVNVLIIDNRIESETIRYPFIRNRYFQIGTRYLDIVLPNLYCKKDKGSSGIFIPIKYLEMLLYLKTYEEKIPLYFTKRYEKINEMNELIRKLDIDIVYDSSGGRMEGFQLKSDMNMLKGIDMESDEYSFKIDKKNNYVKFNLNGKIDRFLNIDVYGNNEEDSSSITFEPVSFDITNNYDFQLLRDVCIKKEDMLSIIPKIKDVRLRKMIVGLYVEGIRNNKNIKYVRMNTFNMDMYHRLKVAQILNTKNHRYLYIGTGDTIFSSHYIVGAGLNRTLMFSIKTCHFFPLLFVA